MFLRVVTKRRAQVRRSQGAGRRFDVCLALCILLLAVLACDVTPPPTAMPASTPTVRVAPTPTVEPDDTGWQSLGNGVELRRLLVADGSGATNRLWLARVDPARVRFRVVYDPANPRPVGEWFADVKPLLAVNAGYFTEDYRATGLVISDGVRSGQSYTGFGGMFAVRSDRVEVRWLVAKPYNSSEPLRHAVQSFPMLVHSGGQPGVGDDDGKLSRRTVVGQDQRGRIVFVVSPDLFFTLKSLAAFLAASDLELDTALNLDGGTSAGMMMAGPAGPVGVDSWIKIPAVIVVDAR